MDVPPEEPGPSDEEPAARRSTGPFPPGLLSGRPAATDVVPGTTYFALDDAGGRRSTSDGLQWIPEEVGAEAIHYVTSRGDLLADNVADALDELDVRTSLTAPFARLRQRALFVEDFFVPTSLGPGDPIAVGSPGTVGGHRLPATVTGAATLTWTDFMGTSAIGAQGTVAATVTDSGDEVRCVAPFVMSGLCAFEVRIELPATGVGNRCEATVGGLTPDGTVAVGLTLATEDRAANPTEWRVSSHTFGNQDDREDRTDLGLVTQGWHTVHVAVVGHAVEFHLDGEVVSTHTTGLPSVMSLPAPGFAVRKLNGSDPRTFQVDYLAVAGDR